MIRFRHALIGSLAAVLVVLLSAHAWADAAAPIQNTETLSIELTVVQASKKGSVDPRLTKLGNDLARSFKGYKGFSFVEAHTFGVKHADSAVKRLKNGKVIVFSNMGKDSQKLRVRLDIDGANVMMKVREGELWFHARREKGAKALILAVRARSVGK